MSAPIGMIAHDFTGALDSIAAFVESPGDTVVLLEPEATAGTARNVVIVAETQTRVPDEAYSMVRDAARRLAGRRLFKRVGSTLRGHIGMEIRAVLDETGTRALVCSALPREGRTVVGGIGRLNSIPLHLTEYGRDPAAPCRQSSLPALLRDGGVEATCVPLRVVRQGAGALCESLLGATSEAVVVDAETDEDLHAIALALAGLGCGWCVCASSGLSPHLASAFGRRSEAPLCALPQCSRRGVLAAIGSTSAVSAAQVARLDGLNDVRVISVQPEPLCVGGAMVSEWAEEAICALAVGRNVVLTTSLSTIVPGLVSEVAPRLGELAAHVACLGRVSTLVLSGGLTALHSCRALGIASVQVSGEVEPGVVCSRGTDRSGNARTMVSKAGGFGDAGTLARLLHLDG